VREALDLLDLGQRRQPSLLDMVAGTPARIVHVKSALAQTPEFQVRIVASLHAEQQVGVDPDQAQCRVLITLCAATVPARSDAVPADQNYMAS
jgi:hypothetical protein